MRWLVASSLLGDQIKAGHRVNTAVMHVNNGTAVGRV